ncbi:DUF896 domain-containing protein [Xylocopilactobacillus apicola]|uniref:UPF0291 protein XA3_06330 n=1 Tax=Xylocopilactobacillus apicola TaxID=2932184 RepID=A0AAU9CW27_9LACO|nr:DUF896 domain-containing protein [Xylocopilactobacillus apicola]BDR58192.1 UPF0291 protein [Xylocopilactobacillus apicola]
MENKYLKRINELAHLAEKGELTDEQKKEQAELRQKYLAEFKEGFRSQIESLKVIDPEGNDVTPDKLKEIQKKKGLRKD